MSDTGGTALAAPLIEIGAHGVPLHVSVPVAGVAGDSARSAAAPTEAIIVLHEIYGLVPAVDAITAKLAAQGYLAVAPALYHRSSAEPVDTVAATKPLERALTAETIETDLADTLDYLAARDIAPRSLGLLGFSMGGTIALWAASRYRLGAAVTFYGGGVTSPRWPDVESGVDCAPRLRAPWLGIYGDRDRSIRVADVERLRAAADTASVATAIVRYPDAGHAFAVDPGAPQYRPDAARDAWARALGWFDAHLR